MPPERCLLSGTTRITATTARQMTKKGIQNSQWYESTERIGPERTMPRPPPMPRIAEVMAMPPATLWRGNSSRMMAYESGKTAPPMPWMARPAIIGPSEEESAAISEPTPSAATATMKTFFLPNMSPRRPAIGVTIDALSR